MDNDKILRQAITKYGSTAQINMAQEECAELIVALSKYINRTNKIDAEKLIERRDDIIDEIADVEIMMRQLRIIFLCDSEVNARVIFKINRLKIMMRANNDI